MDGLRALVTGFMRPTASLGSCPYHKESAQWAAGGPHRGARPGQGRVMAYRTAGLRLPGGSTVFCSAGAQPTSAPHLAAWCCHQMVDLLLQDHQGLLMGVRPLQEHPPAVLPGGLDTEFPLSGHTVL